MKVQVLILLLATSPAVAQSPFQNLDFEQATVVPVSPGYISASSALPYWTARYNGNMTTTIWSAPNALDQASIALVSASPYPPLQGSYSVFLSAYEDPAGQYGTASSIDQTGFIPLGTRSIQFLTYENTFAKPVVTLNGTPISLFASSQSGAVLTMVGDVSSFAGTTATLAFLCQGAAAPFPANENYFYVDDIQFSPSSIPEPSGLALFALATALLSLRFLLGGALYKESGPPPTQNQAQRVPSRNPG